MGAPGERLADDFGLRPLLLPIYIVPFLLTLICGPNLPPNVAASDDRDCGFVAAGAPGGPLFLELSCSVPGFGPSSIWLRSLFRFTVFILLILPMIVFMMSCPLPLLRKGFSPTEASPDSGASVGGWVSCGRVGGKRLGRPRFLAMGLGGLKSTSGCKTGGSCSSLDLSRLE